MKRIVKKHFAVLSLILIFISSSCSLLDYKLTEGLYRDMKVEERANDLKILDNEQNLQNLTSEDEYDVLIITDIHVGNENKGKNGPRREAEWLEHITQIDPITGNSISQNVLFAISLGDSAEHGYREEFERFNIIVKDKLEDIKTSKAPEGIKLYNIVGNHDLYNSGWDVWSETQYPGTSFYKFETPSFSWYFLDTASGTVGADQLRIFQNAMEKDNKEKLVFSHVPLYADNFLYFVMQNSEERNKIINTSAKNRTQLFIDGHTHEEKYTDFGKFQEINLPGFLEKYGYGILHVNEKTKSVSLEVKYY